ncbi:MAG: hypothetical protein O2894_07825 [Planctomycetota bacterium]|nr:hypothetical protein [Planctomycetota bacterium]
MRRSVLLLLPALLALAAADAGAQDDVRWRLGASELAVYERKPIQGKAAKPPAAATAVITVHGHDLRDAGQYSPASPVRGDLFQLLAFRLPAPGAGTTAVKFDWKAADAAPIRIEGSLKLVEIVGNTAKITGAYTFKPRGKVSREDAFRLDDGVVETEIIFDLAHGVIEQAQVVMAYEREDMRRDGPEALLDRTPAYTYKRTHLERRSVEDFQPRVDAAIAKGLAYLEKAQQADGTWKPHGDYQIGTTALTLLTLVACGRARTEPSVARGLAWVFQQEPKRTYEQATCLLAIDRAFTPESEIADRVAGRAVTRHERKLAPKEMAWVRRTAAALEQGATGAGGSWGYPADGRSRMTFDSSNTQYAVLGLQAATNLGYEVDERTWLGVIRHCREVQERKGPKGDVSIVRQGTAIPDEASAHRVNVQSSAKIAGFAYATIDSHDHVCASMTCAGITMLVIARHALRSSGSKRWDRKLEAEVDALILGAWGWMDAHWAMDRNAMHPTHQWHEYALYSLERAALLDEVKRVGGKDWYFEGALQLVHRQGKSGDWNDPGADAIAPTCFALLFLKRGTTPLGGPVSGK